MKRNRQPRVSGESKISFPGTLSPLTSIFLAAFLHSVKILLQFVFHSDHIRCVVIRHTWCLSAMVWLLRLNRYVLNYWGTVGYNSVFSDSDFNQSINTAIWINFANSAPWTWHPLNININACNLYYQWSVHRIWGVAMENIFVQVLPQTSIIYSCIFKRKAFFQSC